ncbi:CMP-N-acetylneuraminate-beta-galactosamide-alpha-2,3-sialyltransferase 2 isoform X2 [Cetorhinus maximus]
MKCSLRVFILFLVLLVAFLTSLFFTYTLTGVTNMAYLETQGVEDAHRVKLVPSYLGVQKLSKDLVGQKTCACDHCVGDPGVSQWFDEHFDQDILPLWTKANMKLDPDVYNWWVMLQPQFKPHNLKDVLSKLFLIVPGENPYSSWNHSRCRRCAVVGNSGNLHQSHYGADINSHDFIMSTYAPVKQFLRVDKDKVQIYNPAFFKYIHDKWTEHHGRYPSTGMLVLFFALHICDEVNVYGFGADSRGNWHHYWENNRYAGEFRKTGVHDADFEAKVINLLAESGKIKVFRGN